MLIAVVGNECQYNPIISSGPLSHSTLLSKQSKYTSLNSCFPVWCSYNSKNHFGIITYYQTICCGYSICQSINKHNRVPQFSHWFENVPLHCALIVRQILNRIWELNMDVTLSSCLNYGKQKQLKTLQLFHGSLCSKPLTQDGKPSVAVNYSHSQQLSRQRLLLTKSIAFVK